MSHLQSNLSGSTGKIHIPDYELEELLNQVEESPFVYNAPDLPPGIASEFLEHVYEFEKAWQQAKTVPVHALLGNPFYLQEGELDDELVEEELQSLIMLMQSKQMTIDVPARKEPRDVYRFLTEFLFAQEIEDLKMEGLRIHFIYNENGEIED